MSELWIIGTMLTLGVALGREPEKLNRLFAEASLGCILAASIVIAMLLLLAWPVCLGRDISQLLKGPKHE